jgi:hypothetical protein
MMKKPNAPWRDQKSSHADASSACQPFDRITSSSPTADGTCACITWTRARGTRPWSDATASRPGRHLYRKIIPHVTAAGYRAVARDYIGFGRSDKPVERAGTPISTTSTGRSFVDQLACGACALLRLGQADNTAVSARRAGDDAVCPGHLLLVRRRSRGPAKAGPNAGSWVSARDARIRRGLVNSRRARVVEPAGAAAYVRTVPGHRRGTARRFAQDARGSGANRAAGFSGGANRTGPHSPVQHGSRHRGGALCPRGPRRRTGGRSWRSRRRTAHRGFGGQSQRGPPRSNTRRKSTWPAEERSVGIPRITRRESRLHPPRCAPEGAGRAGSSA